MPRPVTVKVAANPEIAKPYDQQDKDFYTERIKEQFEIAEDLIAAKVTEPQPCQHTPDLYTSDRYQPAKCLTMAKQICKLCTTYERCLEVSVLEPRTSSVIYAGLSAKGRKKIQDRRGVLQQGLK